MHVIACIAVSFYFFPHTQTHTSLFLSPSHSLSHTLSLYLSLHLTLSPSLPPSLSLSLSLSLSILKPNPNTQKGYDRLHVFACVCLGSGITTIVLALLTNNPFIVCPPTAICEYLLAAGLKYSLGRYQINLVVCSTGVLIFCLGVFNFLARFIGRLIPQCIQIGSTVGIGLLVSLLVC